MHIKSVQGSWDGGTIALKGSRLILTWENGHGAFEVDLEAPETRVTRNGEQINISLSSATVEFPEVQFRAENEQKGMSWYMTITSTIKDKKTQREAEQRRAAERKQQKVKENANTQNQPKVETRRTGSPDRERISKIADKQIEARSPVSTAAKSVSVEYSPKHVFKSDLSQTLLSQGIEVETPEQTPEQSLVQHSVNNSTTTHDNTEENNCCKFCIIT